MGTHGMKRAGGGQTDHLICVLGKLRQHLARGDGDGDDQPIRALPPEPPQGRAHAGPGRDTVIDHQNGLACDRHHGPHPIPHCPPPRDFGNRGGCQLRDVGL